MDTATDTTPRWRVLVAITVVAAALFSLVASPRTALYWYIFPLFGLGGAYLVQFRSEIPSRWRFAFAASAVLSAVALAANWPFSGHVLWNVLFIGHAWLTGKRRSTWMALLVASLVYLFVLKVVSQTGRDVVGGFIAVAVAVVALLVLQRRDATPRA